MIFHKDPIAYDAWVDQPDLDETLLAFAVTDKIPVTLAIAHPLQSDHASKTTAAICKQFIQDRFLQVSTWMPNHSFSWSGELSKQLSEIKQWVMPKDTTLYQSIGQMVWLNWIIVVHPRTAYLLSIGQIHTHLLRQREWQSWWEVPVDFAVSDGFTGSPRPDELPTISLRQINLLHGDKIIIADQSESLQFALCLNRKDAPVMQDIARKTIEEMVQQMNQLHLTLPKQSIGFLQVL